jgi:hypothetical protein
MPRATVPKHGPGCRPLAGTRSIRFPGEPQYVCTARCPRRDALAREYDTACVGAASRFGPVVVIRVERPTPEAAAAAAAGVEPGCQPGYGRLQGVLVPEIAGRPPVPASPGDEHARRD